MNEKFSLLEQTLVIMAILAIIFAFLLVIFGDINIASFGSGVVFGEY